ncbi:MAG TPA: YdcF family protein [Bacteroidia bacterium]|jgi:uncharacterized SAM-binding protein YcdF (DUF218 family)|nr:YdcF family protein [Bacteroidia bacterium]
MFFILSKILEFLITPIFWIFILLLAGILVKRHPLKKRLLIASFAMFYFFSNDYIQDACMYCWEIPATPDSAIQGKYDVAIILGGISNYDNKLNRIQFFHGSDRLLQAYQLYKQGKVRKLLIDGGSGNLRGVNVEGPNLRRYLLNVGVPDTDILLEPKSRNTHENATFAKHLLDSVAPNGRYLLVTSGYHMRRAVGCFNKAGIHTLTYTTDRIAGPQKYDLDYLFIPDVGALTTWQILIHECVGYLSYKIAGYL